MSSTVTQIRRVAPQRPHDHIYDPVYTVSNMGVHLQEHNAARMGQVERVPNYDNMFSVLTTNPRHMYRLSEDKIPMPAFPPAGSIRPTDESTVLGTLRTKFYKRPVVPFMHAVPTEFLVVPQDGQAEQANQNTQEEEPLTKTVGVQTMYRESQTQTDPYTADYITSPGQANPEVLSIAHLTYGNGLPASMEEIQLITRLREKKAFEAGLPPITDENSMKQRKKLLEARELKEWALREEEMQKEQQEKLQMLIDTLKAREDKVAMLNEARVELVRQEKLEVRDQGFEDIHKERQKVQRQMQAARQENTRGKARDILGEFSDFKSQVYAPMAREGCMPVKNQVVDYGIPLINNFQGLLALERTLPSNVLKVSVAKPAGALVPSDRKTAKVHADIDYIDKLQQEKKLQKKVEKITNVYKRFEPVVRPPPPSVEVPEDAGLDASVRLLQRLLRGRAVQNVMYAGKNKNAHLIHELRLAERVSADKKDDEEEEEARHMEAATDTLQGVVISHALDFLSKEMIRLQEERKIMQHYEHAQWARRTREAEESGRRQTEHLLRKKKEEQLALVLDVHQKSAHQFLDGALRAAVEHSADKLAVEIANIQKNHLDPIVDGLEKKEYDARTVVSDLLSSLVMPEVAKEHEKRLQQVKDRRYITAAHKAAILGFEDVNAINHGQTPSRRE